MVEDHAAALEHELSRELGRKHQLYGKSVAAIATCDHSDDVVFRLPDGQYALVHLTWSARPEKDPRWPHTVVYPTLDAIEFDEYQ